MSESTSSPPSLAFLTSKKANLQLKSQSSSQQTLERRDILSRSPNACRAMALFSTSNRQQFSYQRHPCRPNGVPLTPLGRHLPSSLSEVADPNRWEGAHYRVWPRASIHRRPDDLEAPVRLRDITADVLASEPPRQAFNILLSAFGEPDIADRILTLTADLNHIQRREDRRRRRQAR